MKKSLSKLKVVTIVLALLTLAGLVVDYIVDKDSFPNIFTLFPLCLLITVLLVMIVIWLFNRLVKSGL